MYVLLQLCILIVIKIFEQTLVRQSTSLDFTIIIFKTEHNHKLIVKISKHKIYISILLDICTF